MNEKTPYIKILFSHALKALFFFFSTWYAVGPCIIPARIIILIKEHDHFHATKVKHVLIIACSGFLPQGVNAIMGPTGSGKTR